MHALEIQEMQPVGGMELNPPRLFAVLSSREDRITLVKSASGHGWRLSLYSRPELLTQCSPASGPPPVILLDRLLPGQDWRRVVRSLTSKWPRPGVVVVSSTYDQNLIEEVERLGGADTLRSPLNPGRLLQVIERTWALCKGQAQVQSGRGSGLNG